MKAKVLSIYDEGSLVETPLIGAKGLSVLIDVDGVRTLFDAGLRGQYLKHNLDHLEIDPNSIGRVVISHMHEDHIGGLSAFMEKWEGNIPVYITPDHGDTRQVRVFGIPMKRTGFRGMSPQEYERMEIVEVSEWTQLSANLFITGYADDAPVKENALVITARNGAVLICGCCHAGIDKMIGHVESMTKKKVTAVIGGVHLIGRKKQEIYAIAEGLKASGPPALYLNHCSGQTQRTHLRERLGLKGVRDFYVGTEIQFDV